MRTLERQEKIPKKSYVFGYVNVRRPSELRTIYSGISSMYYDRFIIVFFKIQNGLANNT